MLSFYSLAARIIAQLEALLCGAGGSPAQLHAAQARGDAVAVHSHGSGLRGARCSGDARMRLLVVPGRWMVMIARGEGLAVRRGGSSAFVDVVTPCEEHLVVVPGKNCPVSALAGGTGVRCWWERGRGDWQALHVHVGLEQEQSAGESALMASLSAICIVGARMNGRWTWQDNCSD